MAAPAWIEPFLTWLTSNPITTTALRRIEGNTKHLRDGDTVFSGTKQFQNNVEMLSQLIVRAETILREVVQISGSLSMLGNISVNERPGFSGTGNLTIGGSGNLIVGGNVSASGEGNFNGNINTNNTLNAASINTGQGAVEAYAMNQPVQTTDNVNFNQVNFNMSRIYTAFTIPTNASTTLPQGFHYVTNLSENIRAFMDIRDSTNTWRTMVSIASRSGANSSGTYVYSDGANVRLRNESLSVTLPMVRMRT